MHILDIYQLAVSAGSGDGRRVREAHLDLGKVTFESSPTMPNRGFGLPYPTAALSTEPPSQGTRILISQLAIVAYRLLHGMRDLKIQIEA